MSGAHLRETLGQNRPLRPHRHRGRALPLFERAARLGIAPVRRMRDAGVPVGLGVDGSASNDSSHLGLEARQAMLVARLGRRRRHGRAQALEIATLGGARVLGRSDIGALEPGKRADLVLWDISGTADGGQWDPVAALIFCARSAPRRLCRRPRRGRRPPPVDRRPETPA